MLTTVVHLKGGDTAILDQEETMTLVRQLNTNNSVVSIKGKPHMKYEVERFESVKQVTCSKCGEQHPHYEPHYCHVIPLMEELPGGETPNKEKLREQLRLVRNRVPSKEAYEQAWGEAWQEPDRKFRSAAIAC